MIDPIEHFILRRSVGTVIDSEEYTALELAGKTAFKVNEVIVVVRDMLTTGIREPLILAIEKLALSGELSDMIEATLVIDGGVF